MNDLETFVAAARELISSIDEQTPDTIIVSGEGADRLGLERGHHYYLMPKTGRSGGRGVTFVERPRVEPAREPAGEPVRVQYRISAATLAFCLGGCILHGESELK